MEKSSVSELITKNLFQQCTKGNLVCPLFSEVWGQIEISHREHDWSLSSKLVAIFSETCISEEQDASAKSLKISC